MFVLGFILLNEAMFLERILDLLADEFDAVLAIDFGSTDGTLEILNKRTEFVVSQTWENSYSKARNNLLRYAGEVGAKSILMLDGDEAIMPSSVKVLREHMDSPAVAQPRMNLLPGHQFHEDSWPDYQVRMFRTDAPVEFILDVHEYPVIRRTQTPVFLTDKCRKVHETIYHYSWLKPMEYVWRKDNNYARLQKGLSVDWTVPVPDNLEPVQRPGVPCKGKWPFDA